MAADQQTYVIKHGGRPQGAGSYGSPETVKSMIAATQPGKITTAAQAYDAMGNAIINAQNALWDAAKVLADHWSGPAADAAQQALRRLHGTAGELVVRSNETAKTLQWYGGSILPMYKNIKWPEKNTDSPAATAAADQVMRNLNERIAQTWDGMPPQIEKNLPYLYDKGDRSEGATASGTAGSGSGGGGYGRHGGVGARRASHKHLSLPHTGGHLPHGLKGSGGHSGIPGSGGADLAGGTPSAPGSLSGGLGAGSNPLPGSATGSGTLGPGPSGTGAFGTSGPGGTLPGAIPPRPDTGRLSVPEEPELPGAGRGPGVRPSSRPGMSNANGAPLASAGGRSDETERERATWLAEDCDVWTGGADAFSGVIGDAPNLLGQSKQDDRDDELLTVDELQRLLDLVDEPAKEPGEDLSQPSTFHFAEEPTFAMGEVDLVDLDDDVLGPDDDASGAQRA
ncbi:MAG: WXG100 family type VII secretion target [Actinoallomurus sp.]